MMSERDRSLRYETWAVRAFVFLPWTIPGLIKTLVQVSNESFIAELIYNLAQALSIYAGLFVGTIFIRCGLALAGFFQGD